MFFSEENLPDEIRQHIDLHRAATLATAHEIVDFLERVCKSSEQDAHLLKAIFVSFVENPASIHYYAGMMNSMLYEHHKICKACGVKHDPDSELAQLITEERAKMRDDPDVEIIPVHGDGHEEILEFLHSQEMVDKINSAWPEFILDVPGWLTELMAEYRVSLVPEDWPKVLCVCGKLYVSLKDRLLRSPDISGCDGCMEKEKWG